MIKIETRKINLKFKSQKKKHACIWYVITTTYTVCESANTQIINRFYWFVPLCIFFRESNNLNLRRWSREFSDHLHLNPYIRIHRLVYLSCSYQN